MLFFSLRDVFAFFNAPALRRAHYLAIKRVAKLILSLHFLCVLSRAVQISHNTYERETLLTGT